MTNINDLNEEQVYEIIDTYLTNKQIEHEDPHKYLVELSPEDQIDFVDNLAADIAKNYTSTEKEIFKKIYSTYQNKYKKEFRSAAIRGAAAAIISDSGNSTVDEATRKRIEEKFKDF